MKKTLFITLLFLIPFIGFSQTTKPVDGFLGIKFGSTKAEVLAALKAKGGVLDRDTTDLLVFTHINLGHLTTYAVYVNFVDGKAYQGQLVFKDEADDRTIDYYNDLVSQVNEIYGTAKSRRVFRSTFTDGDGYETTAIKEGDADYNTIWTADNKNTIRATINDHLYVFLIYQDSVLTNQSIAQQKAKEKGDF